MTQLLDLPVELLHQLPPNIGNIEDFIHMAATCRTLRKVFIKTDSNTILRLAAASSPVFFNEHELVMMVARQLSDWALGNQERTQRMIQAFQGGIRGLLNLCTLKCGITMHQIREIRNIRYTILHTLSNKVDKMAGTQWYSAPDFWESDADSEADSVDANKTILQLIIYGELFGTTIESLISSTKGAPYFNLETRLEYVKYNLPDINCKLGYYGMEVLPIGPYHPENAAAGLGDDQVVMFHLLGSRTWRRFWSRLLRQFGRDLVPEWKQQVWLDSIQLTGLEAMKLVTLDDPVGSLPQAAKDHIMQKRQWVQDLDKPDDMAIIPNLRDEAFRCCARLWPGRVWMFVPAETNPFFFPHGISEFGPGSIFTTEPENEAQTSINQSIEGQQAQNLEELEALTTV